MPTLLKVRPWRTTEGRFSPGRAIDCRCSAAGEPEVPPGFGERSWHAESLHPRRAMTRSSVNEDQPHLFHKTSPIVSTSKESSPEAPGASRTLHQISWSFATSQQITDCRQTYPTIPA